MTEPKALLKSRNTTSTGPNGPSDGHHLGEVGVTASPSTRGEESRSRGKGLAHIQSNPGGGSGTDTHSPNTSVPFITSPSRSSTQVFSQLHTGGDNALIILLPPPEHFCITFKQVWGDELASHMQSAYIMSSVLGWTDVRLEASLYA